MKVVVLTPIGPGHAALAKEAEDSVRAAWGKSQGPFSVLEHHGIFDLDGAKGRSHTRNLLLRDATAAKADWIFWLDADDLMHPDAFSALQTALGELPGTEAVWGEIVEQAGSGPVLVRPRQEYPADLSELVRCDPFLTIQMGYFVQTAVQEQHPWREDMDAGEDFAMYLSLWREHCCWKMRSPLFINRRGFHSTGPRSATGARWRREVLSMLELEKARMAR